MGRAPFHPVPMSTCKVTFRGPPLTRRLRGSLAAASITVVDRHQTTGWGGQIQEYLVSLDARDPEDAVSRIRAVLEGGGGFAAFAPA